MKLPKVGRKGVELNICLITILLLMAIIGIFPVLLGVATLALGAITGLYAAFAAGNSLEHYSADKIATQTINKEDNSISKSAL
jgi:uncharacterized membrane protein YdjX (TVP38/TMEM64 family)